MPVIGPQYMGPFARASSRRFQEAINLEQQLISVAVPVHQRRHWRHTSDMRRVLIRSRECCFMLAIDIRKRHSCKAGQKRFLSTLEVSS